MTKCTSVLFRAGVAAVAAALLASFMTESVWAQSPDTASPDISALLPRDLSPWGMFLHADLVVKLVLIGLAFASLVTWTACLAKAIELWSAKRRVHEHLRALARASTLREVDASARDAVSRLIGAAEREIELSANLRTDGVKE